MKVSCYSKKLVLGFLPVQPVWPDLAKFRHFGKILEDFGSLLKGRFSIWQKFEPTLANLLCYWANFSVVGKQPNIEKVI